jgi:hypothetical protein
MRTRLASTGLSASLLRFGPSIILRTSLLAVLLVACTPSAVNEISPAQPTAPAIVLQPSATLQANIPSLTPETIPTEALVSTALPVATSRGPNLEATDPLTVSLASGQIQFVEFFRFT